LAAGLLGRGHQPAIVSRGYGGAERGPARVPSAAGGAGGPADGLSGAAAGIEVAARFGDEPTWLARALPDVPVFVARDRVAAARAACAAGAGCLIADDAFQHRRLRRDFDLVVVDATEPLWHYWPLPAGRAREPLSALARASAIVINKVNLVADDRLATVRDAVRLALSSASRPGAPQGWTECEYSIRALGRLDGGEEPLAAFRGQRVFCASGLGRPAAFRATLRLSADIEIAGSLDFPDHRAYDEADLALIERRAIEAGADAIAITEKDAVKMGGWAPRLPVRIARLKAEPAGGWEPMHAEIERLLF
jgi:tetraacyldisaccharide 4'-kinase